MWKLIGEAPWECWVFDLNLLGRLEVRHCPEQSMGESGEWFVSWEGKYTEYSLGWTNDPEKGKRRIEYWFFGEMCELLDDNGWHQ
jgi:hypothetical protein